MDETMIDSGPRVLLSDFVRGARRAGLSALPLPASIRTMVHAALSRAIRPGVAASSVLQPGIAFIGYPRAEFGLGEALRLLAAGAERATLPFSAVDIDHGIGARQEDHRLAGCISSLLDRRVNLLVHTPQFARHAVRMFGRAAFAGRHNIFYAFWELPELPSAWLPELEVFDEVWAPTRFVAKALAAKLSARVSILPPPIHLPAIPWRRRSDFDLPADRFLFHFVFDFSSHMARKNPQAVIEAFRKCAAQLPAGRVGLVLKMMGNEPNHSDRRRLAQFIDGADDIFVIDRTMARGDVLALQSLCDCFVSLHRSEGFGLGIAEAMALGKPVIATNFGGAADLLGPDRACPVRYRMIPLRRGEYPGGEGQYWADPNVEEAAIWMRRMAEQADWARRLGAAARGFIGETLAPERIGAEMRRRLGAAAGLAIPRSGTDQRQPTSALIV